MNISANLLHGLETEGLKYSPWSAVIYINIITIIVIVLYFFE